MDFSELYKQTSSQCQFSPNGKYLASILSFRVIIRDAETLEILHLFNFIDKVDRICWNSTSTLLACASFKLGTIQVWNLQQENASNPQQGAWKCRIDEGVAGLVGMMFDPLGTHLLTFSDFKARYCFRSDGKYFAIAERKDCKDAISIYDCMDWCLVKHFYPETQDLENIAWSPDGRYIAVWESCLQYKLLIYYPDGHLVATYDRQEPFLGIKTVQWSPSSQLLAIGGYDQKVRLLNHYTWKPIIEFSHPTALDACDIEIFKEIDQEEIKKMSKWESAVEQCNIRYHVIRPPISLHTIKYDLEKPHPKVGVGLLEFSRDGRFVCTRNDNMPNMLWLFDLMTLRQVALVIQQDAHVIKCVKWNPLKPNMFVFLCVDKAKSTSNSSSHALSSFESGPEGYVYMWNGKDVEAVQVPAVNFMVHSIEWNSDGTSLVLMDKDKYCVAYLVQE